MVGVPTVWCTIGGHDGFCEVRLSAVAWDHYQTWRRSISMLRKMRGRMRSVQAIGAA